jgi:SAM-dependent methyltransferase
MLSADEWTGRTGDAWAAEWRRTDRSFADLSHQLNAAILAAAPAGAFRALDIGCGAGGTSLALAEARPDAAIVGVDLSRELLAVARARGGDRLTLVQGDAATAAAEYGPFDLMVSRHGVMFFADPVAAFAALRRQATPGVRLVFSCFRARAENEWMRVVDAALGTAAPAEEGYAPGPFGFADAGFTGSMLAQAGWSEATPRSVDYIYVAGEGDEPLEDAMSFLGRIGPASRTLAAAPKSERAALRERLRTALAPHVAGGRVTFRAAAWIWTATAGDAA